jgi:hypothetical protein
MDACSERAPRECLTLRSAETLVGPIPVFDRLRSSACERYQYSLFRQPCPFHQPTAANMHGIRHCTSGHHCLPSSRMDRPRINGSPSSDLSGILPEQSGASPIATTGTASVRYPTRELGEAHLRVDAGLKRTCSVQQNGKSCNITRAADLLCSLSRMRFCSGGPPSPSSRTPALTWSKLVRGSRPFRYSKYVMPGAR